MIHSVDGSLNVVCRHDAVMACASWSWPRWSIPTGSVLAWPRSGVITNRSVEELVSVPDLAYFLLFRYGYDCNFPLLFVVASPAFRCTLSSSPFNQFAGSPGLSFAAGNHAQHLFYTAGTEALPSFPCTEGNQAAGPRACPEPGAACIH